LDSNSSSELTLRDLAVIFRRRRRVVYGSVTLLALLAALYCLVSTRRYEATATVQVQSKSQDNLGLDSMPGGPQEGDTDALAANINIQTQASILQSDTLALKTVEELHMENTKDFIPHWNPISWALGLFSPSGVADPPNASLEDSPKRRRRVLTVFSHNLTVKPIGGTRLIQISYLNPDPKLAARVVNTLTQSLIDYSFQTRFEATNQAADWLSGQLGELRQQSEQLQRQVADLESKSGVYTLGTVDAQGHDQTYSGVLDKLQQATTALSQAEQNRILRGAILHAAENGDAEMLSSLAGNASNGSGVSNSLTLIQNLRSQQATQEAALKQAELKFGKAYPKLEELRGNISALQQSIQQEIDRLKERAKSDYEDATQTEAETRVEYNKAKADADTLNNKSIDFAVLRQEADESRKLYQELLERFKQAGILESLKGSTVTVVDPGRAPDKPTKPNIPRNMVIAIGGGFLLGCCLALVIDLLDNKVNTIGEVERISGDHLLGVTPFFNTKLASSNHQDAPLLASLDDPQSPFIEAARAIRTEILLKDGKGPSRVILVTSSIPGEGKTILSGNLAILLAQASKKVLLIDTDLRLGVLHLALNLPAGTGLSELLANHLPEPDIHSISDVPNLDVLLAGMPPANPSEMLGSSSFSHWLSVWRKEYDYIVLDSAPLLPVTDSLTMAPLSDITLLVARQGLTEKSQLSRSYQLLTRNSTQSVAVVLNGLRPEEEGYSSYFGYHKPVKYGAIVKSGK
jgi:polysaccharide biosynthesis transport protein